MVSDKKILKDFKNFKVLLPRQTEFLKESKEKANAWTDRQTDGQMHN